MLQNKKISSEEGLKVYLNVYDLQKQQGFFSGLQNSVGLGTYHSGVEIRNTEYMFSSEEYTTILELNNIINQLKTSFKPSEYHPLRKNCNHFSNELCKILVGANIPSWVNRTSSVGSFFSNFLPKKTEQSLIDQAQVKQFFDNSNIEKHENQNIFTSVNNIVNMKSIECLNQKKPNIVQNIFELSDRKFLESDVDEQLIIRIPFISNVDITCLIIKCLDRLKCPREILVFTNKNGVSIDFDNVDSNEPTQVIEMDPEQCVKEVAIPLKIAKFKNISVLTLFVTNNFGANTTQINNLNIIGRSGMSVDLTKLSNNCPSCTGGSCQ
ncbi:DUF862/DUF1000 domain-containing protein [Naegleria gruberi]|uniref:DUF862/DUF1000 domain-containing protein n=1 Tax=Naegleria gruberi TaxID=5762 RepID=D2UZT1_NAEGR|nr:DUF862/DUF1000 domain-containing protein [Naegleria gruberi]EFC50217.1 DUF862/DUF1000 domain-containing protein [Naegleria gruberi]|eukprot:XP_002682961.1 DUF862/DUF1000 domain-containing protein [Naegleria gruberi strain NEG-M]